MQPCKMKRCGYESSSLLSTGMVDPHSGISLFDGSRIYMLCVSDAKKKTQHEFL